MKIQPKRSSRIQNRKKNPFYKAEDISLLKRRGRLKDNKEDASKRPTRIKKPNPLYDISEMSIIEKILKKPSKPKVLIHKTNSVKIEPLVTVQELSSGFHGAMATRDISPGETICFWEGFVIRNPQNFKATNQLKYPKAINPEDYVISWSAFGHLSLVYPYYDKKYPAGFLNTDVASPNITIEGDSLDALRLVATRPIKAGEECTWDYGPFRNYESFSHYNANNDARFVKFLKELSKNNLSNITKQLKKTPKAYFTQVGPNGLTASFALISNDKLSDKQKAKLLSSFLEEGAYPLARTFANPKTLLEMTVEQDLIECFTVMMHHITHNGPYCKTASSQLQKKPRILVETLLNYGEEHNNLFQKICIKSPFFMVAVDCLKQHPGFLVEELVDLFELFAQYLEATYPDNLLKREFRSTDAAEIEKIQAILDMFYFKYQAEIIQMKFNKARTRAKAQIEKWGFNKHKVDEYTSKVHTKRKAVDEPDVSTPKNKKRNKRNCLSLFFKQPLDSSDSSSESNLRLV